MLSDMLENLDQATPLAESNGCGVYRVKNETGEGTMTTCRLCRPAAGGRGLEAGLNAAPSAVRFGRQGAFCYMLTKSR